MSPALLAGFCAIAPTPFLPDGRIDEASIDRMTEFFAAAGCSGITVLGRPGEAPKPDGHAALSVATRVIRRMRLPVIVGVSAPGFAAMRTLARPSMDAGAPGGIAPPDTLRGDETNGTEVPFVIQDDPLTFSVQMTPAVIRRIGQDNASCAMLEHEDWPGLETISAAALPAMPPCARCCSASCSRWCSATRRSSCRPCCAWRATQSARSHSRAGARCCRRWRGRPSSSTRPLPHCAAAGARAIAPPGPPESRRASGGAAAPRPPAPTSPPEGFFPRHQEMTLKFAELEQFMAQLEVRDPHQPEYLQAVREVMTSLWPFVQAHPKYAEHALLERLVEPERLIHFRVAWVDDRGRTQVNRAFRVQHSSAIGPYKGGMRFHPSVTLSILKFLAFEQTLKNSLTTLPMGGGKGGSDFDPKGKSDGEIMRFCQALMIELYRHLGPNTDVPAGDIGVGAREVGFMAGAMKKLANDTSCVFTGKGLSFGGSLMRPEATGYGTVYFAQEMLRRAHRSVDGLRVSISGSGNVAQYAAEKAIELGARVITLSDSDGTVVDRDGIDTEKLRAVMELKNVRRGRLSEFAAHYGLRFEAGRRPWHVPTDIALPCATQNELDEHDADTLLANDVLCVAEGANMPSTLEAVERFQRAGTLYAPGKASNAGGVATSGLEMSQNANRLSWSAGEVDERLHAIMKDIHEHCVRHGRRADGSINYVDGANIAGFVKVADAMLAQGVY